VTATNGQQRAKAPPSEKSGRCSLPESLKADLVALLAEALVQDVAATIDRETDEATLEIRPDAHDHHQHGERRTAGALEERS